MKTMADKSVRELELIIQRLNSQIEAKNEQIDELNRFIQKATDDTQELIRNFRAFCIKVLESELAYGEITSRDLEGMSLTELLSRARKMLKQNQEKARSIYDLFKERLEQKNKLIEGHKDQISQLMYKVERAEEFFKKPYDKPDDCKRTPAYLMDTKTEVDALRPALGSTYIDDNERPVDMDGAADKDSVPTVSNGHMYVQDLNDIINQMKEVHWDILKLIVESGKSETSEIRKMICRSIRDEEELIGIDKAGRLIRQMVLEMKLFTQKKINTGMRWFQILILTEIGQKLYIEKYANKPPITEYEMMIRDHDNAEHGYIIRDVAQILKDTGKYKSVSMSRKGNTIKLKDGKSCIPDIICSGPGLLEYYEVECGNHHQSDFNDKCDKLKSITADLFFVTPNRETAEKKLKVQIEEWIKVCDRERLQIAGVTVYLTSISDLARQMWTYVFDMKSDQPIFTLDVNKDKKEEEG